MITTSKDYTQAHVLTLIKKLYSLIQEAAKLYIESNF